jgi:hypothetical protein
VSDNSFSEVDCFRSSWIKIIEGTVEPHRDEVNTPIISTLDDS